MKKLSFLLAVIMMLSFSACGGGTGTTSNEQTTQNTEQTEQATEETAEPAAEATAKSPDNDLVVAMQADATHLDPHVSGNGVSNTVTNAMYESLVTFDADTNIVPMLAKEWSMSDDGLSYTFVLNEGITFRAVQCGSGYCQLGTRQIRPVAENLHPDPVVGKRCGRQRVPADHHTR